MEEWGMGQMGWKNIGHAPGFVLALVLERLFPSVNEINLDAFQSRPGSCRRLNQIEGEEYEGGWRPAVRARVGATNSEPQTPNDERSMVKELEKGAGYRYVEGQLIPPSPGNLIQSCMGNPYVLGDGSI
jgi:hypothetical protein